MARKIQVKRGNQSDIPNLDVGEFGFTMDESRTYIGSSSGNIELAKQSEVASQLAEMTLYTKVTPNEPVDILASGSGTTITMGANHNLKAGDLIAIANGGSAKSAMEPLEYNYLRSTVSAVNGQTITISNALQRTVTNALVKRDDTELLRGALAASKTSTKKLLITDGVLNVFDKMPTIQGIEEFEIVYNNARIDATNIVGIKQPYEFNGSTLFYTDGQLFSFGELKKVILRNVDALGKEQMLFKFSGTQNVYFEKCSLEFSKSNLMNHALIGVYSSASGQQPKNFNFTDCKLKTGGMCFIANGDINNPVKGVSFNKCNFELLDDGNYGALKLTEHVKIDTGTDGVKFIDCEFNGGELSSVTIEEGSKNIEFERCNFNKTKDKAVRIAVGQTLVKNGEIKFKSCNFKNYIFGVYQETTSASMRVSDRLILKDCIFDVGTASNPGTSIYAAKGAYVGIDNVEFLNANNALGGLIVVPSTDVVVIGRVEARNLSLNARIRTLDTASVTIKDTNVPTTLIERASTVRFLRNSLQYMAIFDDVVTADIMSSEFGLANSASLAGVNPLIELKGTNQTYGNYSIHQNRLYSLRAGQQGIVNRDTQRITITQSQNILQGTVV
ncbi:hypothetical protein EVJ32_05125 [Exiguobacterium sp. SH5S4]|uniref:hypothetical protein n=1 Tax=Exiguobacterium sp. SH5S4 TaxID=2510961 RepID=UPI0010388307|nr:hypothetical protein [Exiguobacterium sp. SH5S4]TCI26760.1 hypothetical protein EVJ32_05125 [Exiguobacterium sp. SH5S4]